MGSIHNETNLWNDQGLHVELNLCVLVLMVLRCGIIYTQVLKNVQI